MSFVDSNLINQGFSLFGQLTGKPVSQSTQNLVSTLAQGYNFYQQQQLANKQKQEQQKQLLLGMMLNQNRQPQQQPAGTIQPMPQVIMQPVAQDKDNKEKDNKLLLYGLIGAGLLLFLMNK